MLPESHGYGRTGRDLNLASYRISDSATALTAIAFDDTPVNS